MARLTVRLSWIQRVGLGTIGLAAATFAQSDPATRSPPDRPLLIPQPSSMKVNSGQFELSVSSWILVQPDRPQYRQVAEYFAEWLNSRLSIDIRIEESDSSTLVRDAVLLTDIGFRRVDWTKGAEASSEDYELFVESYGAMLRAGTAEGLFRSTQTLRQLFDPTFESQSANPRPRSARLPCVIIRDTPSYAWRGMLLDCGRHFMPKEFIKRYIDLLAYHKMNVLHWHLTEDQGWRIQIRKYPKLTETGAWRRITRDSERGSPAAAGGADPAQRDVYGGFYTQDDVREIVAYAQHRHITVVPEIEMPGHSRAALAAYPELSCTGGPFEVGTEWGVYEDVYCAGNDETFAFLEGVLTEVLELFPSRYIHIGGDECPKQRWKACPKCQARIRSEHLKDEHELQSYFVRRIETLLNSKGRRLVGWDEILEGGLAPNATVQSWRGMAGAVAAATTGHDVIASPNTHCYLDHAQGDGLGEPRFMGFCPLERTYTFDPTPPGLTPDQARHILGIEGNMWTEHAPPELVDRQVFPRLAAIAEIGWSMPSQREWEDFQRRLAVHYRRLDALGVNYYIPPPAIKAEGAAGLTDDWPLIDAFEGVCLDAPPIDGAVVRYTLDGSEPTPASPAASGPLTVTSAGTLRARAFLPNGRGGMIAERRFRKLVPHEAVSAGATQPGLMCEYYEGAWTALPAFDALTAQRRGQTSFAERSRLALRNRDENFAMRYRGFLEVHVDGVYQFYVTSDDGGRLKIGEETVVDLDGLHAAATRSGSVLLKTGKHPITLEYFQAGGAMKLKIEYAGPDQPRRPLSLPALSHAAP